MAHAWAAAAAWDAAAAAPAAAAAEQGQKLPPKQQQQQRAAAHLSTFETTRQMGRPSAAAALTARSVPTITPSTAGDNKKDACLG